MSAACSRCVFWKPEWEGAETGQCRVNPPVVLHLGGGGVATLWPQTEEDAWCGEFHDGATDDEISFTPDVN